MREEQIYIILKGDSQIGTSNEFLKILTMEK
jgi:F420-dependent methylenetetrahydromethanopterin dehydrogenase